jgi:hypothetical protein
MFTGGLACLCVGLLGACDAADTAGDPDWDAVADVRGGSGHQGSAVARDGGDAGVTFRAAQPQSADPALDMQGLELAATECADGLLDPDRRCDSRVPPQRLTKTYQGACGPDARVQWGFLTYVAKTPGDSLIAFKIRTAETQLELASREWMDLASAQASPDTQTCGFAGPSPCPIDLYVVLGGAPRAHELFAEITLLSYPSTDGLSMPTIDRYQLNYSCPFNQ